jgi:hypothetical protein
VYAVRPDAAGPGGEAAHAEQRRRLMAAGVGVGPYATCDALCRVRGDVSAALAGQALILQCSACLAGRSLHPAVVLNAPPKATRRRHRLPSLSELVALTDMAPFCLTDPGQVAGGHAGPFHHHHRLIVRCAEPEMTGNEARRGHRTSAGDACRAARRFVLALPASVLPQDTWKAARGMGAAGQAPAVQDGAQWCLE